MAAKPPSSRPSSAIRQSPKSKRDVGGFETKELLANAREVGNKISTDEQKTRRLLRAVYDAQQAAKHPSIKECLVQFYLRTKYDTVILQDFAKLVLGPSSTAISSSQGPGFDFSVEVEDIMRVDPMDQLHNVIQISESFKNLVYHICGRLLSHVGDNDQDDVSLPPLCSPAFNNLMTLITSYLQTQNTLTDIELADADRRSNTVIATLKQQNATLEKELAVVSAEHLALKSRFDTLFKEGTRHQSAIRQQATIDDLEIQVRKLTKELEGVEDDRLKFLKKESILRDCLLQTTTQLNTLRTVYDAEIATLRPLLYEQLEHVKEDRRHMLNLRTDVSLSANRINLSEAHSCALEQQLDEAKNEKVQLESRLKAFEEQYEKLLKDNGRLERLSNVTLAAKLHGDDTIQEITEKLRRKIDELVDAKEHIKFNTLEVAKLKDDIARMHLQLDDTKAEAEKFYVKSQAGIADMAAQEIEVTQLKEQLQNFVKSGCTPEKQEELESKDRVIQELQDLLKRTKKQLKLSLSRVYELQEEVDHLRLNNPGSDDKVSHCNYPSEDVEKS